MRLERQLELARHYYREFVRVLQGCREGRESVYAVERLAQLVAQSVLDLAAMLAVRERGEKPSTYRGLARWLAERLGLDSDSARFLEGLAGLHNILVHGYASIDRELEEQAFNEIADVMPRILEALERVARGDPCLDDAVNAIARVPRGWSIEYVIVFGSLARRGCGRDVDLAVKFRSRPRSGIELGRLAAELEEAVGAPVDLVDLDAAPTHLLKTVIDEDVIVYGDRERALEDLARRYTELLDIEQA